MSLQQIIVGISGGSGSGKTTILSHLKNYFAIDEICIVSQDNYYFPIDKQVKDQNGIVNFDLPSSIDSHLLCQHIQQLRAGQTVEHVEYTFNNNSRESSSLLLNPAQIVVIEGLFIFHIESIKRELDLSIFIDVSKQVRLERRIIRDNVERGYPKKDVEYQWKNHVEPAYDNFLDPYKPHCDLVINNNLSFDVGLAELIALIERERVQKK